MSWPAHLAAQASASQLPRVDARRAPALEPILPTNLTHHTNGEKAKAAQFVPFVRFLGNQSCPGDAQGRPGISKPLDTPSKQC